VPSREISEGEEQNFERFGCLWRRESVDLLVKEVTKELTRSFPLQLVRL